ncbi:MAG: radical SAM protein [Chloroflexi bacterium]|nr:radical SAM protein [Chloroflexota bacterium]
MKVALISPRGAERNQQNNLLREVYRKLSDALCFVEVDDIEFMPHLGLLSIASYIPGDWEVSYIDENYIDLNGVAPSFFLGDFDLICLGGFNHQAKRAYQIASFFKQRNIPVVMGGLHASALPEEALQHVDVVIIGEGEDAFPKFLENFQKGKYERIYRSSGEVDLTKVPPPRYDLININNYNKIPIVATRGCPHDCEFCCLKGIYGHKHRKKTVEQVCREIEIIKSLGEERFISFADENMLVDREYAKKLLRALIPYNITYECYCDTASAQDPELIDLLRESGCIEALIGFESVDMENLENLEPWKARQLRGYPKVIEAFQSRGVGVVGLFVVGFDHDGPDVFKRILDFCNENAIFDIDVSILTPIPGSRFFDKLRGNGRMLSTDWDHYNWHHVNFRPKLMTPKELRQGLNWLYKEFYRQEDVTGRYMRFGKVFDSLFDHGIAR